MTLSEIKRIANNVIQKYELIKLPIDIRELCRKENIVVFDNYDTSVLMSDGDIAKGLITGVYFSNAYLGDGTATKAILVSDTEQGEWRKRFTIAHELGHHFLCGETTFSFRRDNSSKEREADVFVAEVLMPEELVEQEYNNNNNLQELANTFSVSYQAMRYRLSSLGIAYYQ